VSRKRKRGEVHLSLRLYWGQDDDLIGWLEQFDGQPYGVKTQAVKEALRRNLSTDGGQAMASQPSLDLAEVRRVVEAAIASALARFEGQMPGAVATAPGEDDEAEDLLDALGDSLVLEEGP
jgi:hypothetical protein